MRYLPFVLGLTASLLWISVVAGPLGKWLGAPRPASFVKRTKLLQGLSFNQYTCLYGALSWGIGCFLANVVDKQLQAVLGIASSRMSAAEVTFALLGWMGSGCIFGWLLWGLGGF